MLNLSYIKAHVIVYNYKKLEMYQGFFTLIAIALAYQVGRQTAQLNAFDYFVTRQYLNQSGMQIVEYLVIDPAGTVVFEVDKALATAFNYMGAANIKKVLRSHAPLLNLQLEIVNPALLN